MGDQRSMLEGSSSSMDDSCPWTEVTALNAQHASRNKQNLDFLPKYDRHLVSVGRKIGEGGQGSVYEAKFHLPYSFRPHSVVVKKFKPFEGVSQGHFPQEIASVKSSNLCIPHGVFFEGDSLCMIMDRYSCDLHAAIDSRMKAVRDEVYGTNGPPFTEEVGGVLILQLAMGLQALHECGVYHGDLKAANILVKTFGKNYEHIGHVVIADFERSEGVVGTAFWRAPEVLQSLITEIPLSKEQWFWADVYSFGMVCYEVLTGMIPFQGHPISDYGLVLNGGRPKLPDHIPQPMRDLIVRCWHVDPHSRPNWSEIIKVLAPNDDVAFNDDLPNDDTSLLDGTWSLINNLGTVESLSFESLIHESKRLVRDLTTLHESDSKSFKREFMPYYWTFEYLMIVEEYASKFLVDSFLESSLTCNVQEAFERMKLFFLLTYQSFGAKFEFMTFLDLLFKGHLDMVGHIHEILLQRERLQVMLHTIHQKVVQKNRSLEFTNEFEIGTSWMSKLLYFHGLFKWFLWYEYADYGTRQMTIGICLEQDSMILALLIFLCMMLNTYIYVFAMITYEPILLGLQYGLYKAKGSNNILYRSLGKRICRFQRAWMNCTRYRVVSIILSFSFVTLFTMYKWRGILGWILFPCIIIYTPYWRQPILVD